MHSSSACTPLPQNISRVIRQRARTFYLASLFLPAHMRRDVHLIYTYFRTIDDLVDAPPEGCSNTMLLTELDEWQVRFESGETEPGTLLEGVFEVAKRHHIPYEYMTLILRGARTDINLSVMETRQDLLDYSVCVAGSVGVVMAHIMGTPHDAALEAARDLGVAMQITNVLRDVGEDVQRGRVYLPLHDLRRHGCSLDSVRGGQVTSAFRDVMLDLMADARAHYASGMGGIRYLDRPAQFSIYLAATLYSRILDKIERHDFDVFSRRAHLSSVEKWSLAVPAYMEHRQVSRRPIT